MIFLKLNSLKRPVLTKSIVSYQQLGITYQPAHHTGQWRT